jgi:hypothetical protein
MAAHGASVLAPLPEPWTTRPRCATVDRAPEETHLLQGGTCCVHE